LYVFEHVFGKALIVKNKKCDPERSARHRTEARLAVLKLSLPSLYLWSERRSPLLLPFELPSQGNSPSTTTFASCVGDPKKEA